MRKSYNERYDETFYEETLSNGLQVVVWYKPNFQNSHFLFATPYGSLHFEEVDKEGNAITFPSGIAHFLEHKMFESEQGDVMEQFSKLGANVNAFTSYNETVYYFSTTSKDVKEEVNLLLDFVQDLHISEESVEKEKGIIIQELNMYMQMPDTRLLFESFKSMYHYHPLNMDIGGSAETVSSTTVEDLRNCHTIHYHPKQMLFIAITSLDPQEVMDMVKDNQSQKEFTKPMDVFTKDFKEPKEVCRKDFSLPMDVTCPKSSIAYKLQPYDGSTKDRVKAEWAIRFLLESYFSNLNDDYQRWLDEGMINDFFGYEIDFGKDYAFLLFYAEMEKDELQLFIQRQLEIMNETFMNEDILEQIKRRYYGMYVRIFDNQESIGINYIRNAFLDMNMYDILEIIESITLDDILQAWKCLDLSNYCVTEIYNKNE